MKFDLSAYFRVFLLILISIAFVLGMTKLGIYAYEKVFTTEEVFSEGTSIGSLSVARLSRNEAQEKLTGAVSEWKQNSQLFLTYSDTKSKLPTENIEFLIDESITDAVNGKENPLITVVAQNIVKQSLAGNVSDEIISAVNLETLTKEINTKAGQLKPDIYTISLSSFFTPESGMTLQTLAEASVELEDDAEITDETTFFIAPDSSFSFLHDVGEKQPHWTDSLLTTAASALYEACLQTNLEVVERQISTERPPGIKVGFEAKIKREGIDFVLINPNDYQLQISYQKVNNDRLHVSIIGFPLLLYYETALESEKTYPFRKIVQYSPFLQKGAETVKNEGRNGYSVVVYRDKYLKDGGKSEREKVSEDFYLPVHQIVLRPMNALTEENDGDEDTDNDEAEQTEDKDKKQNTDRKDTEDESKLLEKAKG